MINKYKLGKLFGLFVTVELSFFIGTLILWATYSGICIWLLDFTLSNAIIGGLVATLLYWISDIVHHLGHAYAARQTGFPMVGIRLGTHLIFAASLYPDDEGMLPAKIHIRRALGGPITSFLFSILMGIIASLLYSSGGTAWFIAAFLFLTNLFIFAIGSLMPLGFTDGSTLLEWWGKR